MRLVDVEAALLADAMGVLEAAGQRGCLDGSGLKALAEIGGALRVVREMKAMGYEIGEGEGQVRDASPGNPQAIEAATKPEGEGREAGARRINPQPLEGAGKPEGEEQEFDASRKNPQALEGAGNPAGRGAGRRRAPPRPASP